MERVAVAYSGGTDSSLLLKVAADELGGSAIAIIVSDEILPALELQQAIATARGMGVEPVVLQTDMLSRPEFHVNRPDRCYVCKHAIFSAIIEEADHHGIKQIVDGSHSGDLDSDRPGRRALRDLGVRSPLTEAGMDKVDIRQCSKLLALPTTERPASPCLATRIPFYEEVTAQKLRQVDEAERAVRELGIEVVRVRHHGMIARIEVPPADMPTLLRSRERLVTRFRALGFVYVDVDLLGYRSGSMGEALKKVEH
jgi:uncharacterized protein